MSIYEKLMIGVTIATAAACATASALMAMMIYA
ncbi:MAG: hypothetical protein JWQ24_2720 [Tardiphaga sp.]|nr:hypothetical protein [Tardiphaga sp.]